MAAANDERTLEDRLTVAGIKMVPIDQVDADPTNPRLRSGDKLRDYRQADIELLAEQIKSVGKVLVPIHVVRHGGRWQAVDGNTRLAAARLAGLTEIPIIQVEGSDEELRQLAGQLNITRNSWDSDAQASHLQWLVKECGYTQERAAQSLGKSKGWATMMMKKEIGQPVNRYRGRQTVPSQFLSKINSRGFDPAALDILERQTLIEIRDRLNGMELEV